MPASARTALAHWLALGVLAVSTLITVGLLLIPALRPWSDRAVWVLLLGVASYGLIALVVYSYRPNPEAPQLTKLRTIRKGIADLLAEGKAARGASQDPVLHGALTDAIAHLDEQVIPALSKLLEREQRLDAHLARIKRGELHAPDPIRLSRLRRIHARQQAAIDECVQQAANAYATLVALLQEGDDARTVQRARGWADDLLKLYDALDEVLRGDDDLTGSDERPTQTEDDSGPDAPASPGGDSRMSSTIVPAGAEPPEVPIDPVTESPATTNRPVELLTPLVEEALRRISDPARLTNCGLMTRLPQTLANRWREAGHDERIQPTPLEQARLLREVLMSALDRLKPDEAVRGRGASEMLRYDVITSGYVEGMTTRQIVIRYGISESTLHRYRRDGVRVLAQELGEQEARFSRDPPDAATG